jgi:hypothetical protein
VEGSGVKPSVKTKCPANIYTGDAERVVEIWDRTLQRGCLLKIFRCEGRLVLVPYRADKGVDVCVHCMDFEIDTITAAEIAKRAREFVRLQTKARLKL